MERYIDVIGEGQFRETVSRFVADVVLQVRAAKDETAFVEIGELSREAISILRGSGITDDEIVEGGSDFQQPWYRKKQIGQAVQRTVILKVADFGRLNRALEKLEPLQSRNKERKTISIAMRQPVFDSEIRAKCAALASAFCDAQEKANELAVKAGGKLGKLLQVEEGGLAKRNSGFSGDSDWWGDSSRFGPAFGGAVVMAAGGGSGMSESNAESAFDPQTPTRDIFVKCRVRFELLDG